MNNYTICNAYNKINEKCSYGPTYYENSMYLHWFVNSYNVRELCLPNQTFKQFYDCKDCRYFVFLIMLHDNFSIFNKSLRKPADMNVVIFDRQCGVLERFDPTNNQYHYDNHILDTVLVNVLQNSLRINIKSIWTPWMICTYGGIQCKQENEVPLSERKLLHNYGLCSLWCLWYIVERVKHPYEAPNDLLNEYKTNETLTKLIQSFQSNYCLKENEFHQSINKI